MGFFSDVGDSLFHGNESPYGDANAEYQKWMDKAMAAQNPFMEFGQRAMPGYEDWAKGQKDPAAFINNLQSQYTQSPWAKYQQEQSARAAQNAASESGLLGSTPYLQQAQQNAHDISSQDMGSWLQNVLGINTQYGNALGNQINVGQNATNKYSDLASGRANGSANIAANQKQGRNEDIGGWLNTAGSVAGMFL